MVEQAELTAITGKHYSRPLRFRDEIRSQLSQGNIGRALLRFRDKLKVTAITAVLRIRDVYPGS
jgi:hypothetical protein